MSPTLQLFPAGLQESYRVLEKGPTWTNTGPSVAHWALLGDAQWEHWKEGSERMYDFQSIQPIALGTYVALVKHPSGR